MRLRVLTACLLCGAMPMTALAAKPSAPTSLAASQADAIVRRFMANFHVPGAQVAVLREGKLVLSKAYGWSDVALKVPATPQSVFSLASITKAFTGVAAMREVASGKLDLNAPIGRYVDGLPESWRQIPVRQLLSHMSGLPDTLRAPTIDTDQDKAWAWTLAQPIRFAQGERFDYCQTNYALIARAINRLEGRAPDAMLALDQIDAAGMNHTSYADSRDVVAGHGPDYRFGTNGKFTQDFHISLPFHRHANGLVSSAEDMAKWVAALRDGTLLPAAARDAMWRPEPFRDGKVGQWGMGWLSVPRGDAHHAVGMTGGARSAVFYYPEDDVAVVILTNRNGAFPEDIADEIAQSFVPGFRLTGFAALRKTLEDTHFADPAGALNSVRRAEPGFTVSEPELNDWGYRLIASDRKREALAAMGLLTTLYPSSGNAWDSLGEAQAFAGDKAAAIASYERSLALDPKNENARQRLRKLRG